MTKHLLLSTIIAFCASYSIVAEAQITSETEAYAKSIEWNECAGVYKVMLDAVGSGSDAESQNNAELLKGLIAGAQFGAYQLKKDFGLTHNTDDLMMEKYEEHKKLMTTSAGVEIIGDNFDSCLKSAEDMLYYFQKFNDSVNNTYK